MNKMIKKRMFSLLLCIVMLFSLVPMTVFATEDIPQQPTTYTVNFDANGGSGTMTSVNNVSGSYTLPPNGFIPPANKQFKCWSVNGIEKNPFESISVTSNVTVKAVWKDIVATSYTVSFDSNGGSGSMASVTNAPSLYTLPANSFTPPANKQFKCWAVGVQNDEYDPGDKITITANVTVKAVWEAITSSRQVISDVVATSSDLDTIFKLYGLIKIPTFNVTQGAPAYINASTSNLIWQKKIEGVWTNQDSGRFTPGEWRISTSLRIDGTDGYYYELGNPTTLTVNGQAWTVENNGKPSVHPDYSHANIDSPAFTIVDDPNVQPPVSVPSVNMILNGYEVGAQISAATVETDAMVDAEVLGFLKMVDSNGDGQPDGYAEATGIFEKDVIYAIAVSLRAKNGYDISDLTAQSVSLDRSLVDIIEELVEYETFNGIYLLDDIIQYTVSFETNGGSAISPIKVANGKTLVPPADPTRAYYAFAGWYKDEELTQAFDFNTPITGDITLYAKWTPSPVGGKFLMTIDFNGGTSTMPASGEVEANSSIYLNPQIEGFVTPPTGKVLAGYEINGVPYNLGEDYLVTQNITLKFLWKDAPVTTYTVSFNANGGTGTMADVTGMSGDYMLPFCEFTAPAGKKFKCWAEDSVSGTQYYAGYGCVVDSNVTFYAIWEDIPVTTYTVTFDSAGGSAVTAQTIEEGQKVTKPADPTKSGFNFKGWTLNGSAYNFNTAVNGDITLVATWETIPAGHDHADNDGDGSCDTCGNPMSTRPGNPSTGDSNIIWALFALMLVGCIVLAVNVFNKKKSSIK
ncbi:MAG: hypothetical protein E7384_00995 [Ruminococcaceae bacterium]|nr:hypothetical protein [Oscillospiraceae bacterium]